MRSWLEEGAQAPDLVNVLLWESERGKVFSSHQRDWEDFLPRVFEAYLMSRHEITWFSPNMLLLGRETRVPVDLVNGRSPDVPDVSANYSSYVEDLA